MTFGVNKINLIFINKYVIKFYIYAVRAAEDVLAQVELENPPQIIQHDQTDDSDLANFVN